MFIPDPDFSASWISDPTTETKEEGEKIIVLTFLNYFIFEQVQEKI
jgi:hypothetical protein